MPKWRKKLTGNGHKNYFMDDKKMSKVLINTFYNKY